LWVFGAYNRVQFPAEISRYQSSELVPSTMTFPLNGTDNLYSGKLTWNPGASTTLVGTVFGDPTTNSGAGRADPRQGTFNARTINTPAPGPWESTRSSGPTYSAPRPSQVSASASLATLQASRHEARYDLVPTGDGLRTRLEDFTCAGGTREEP